MLTPRRTGTALVTALVALALAGCTPVAAGRCVDWVSLPTAAERSDAAALVVDATVRRTDRTVEDAGRYPVYRATVDRVVQGTVDGRALDVVSTSDRCTSSGEPVEYVDGDVLAHDGRYRLWLVRLADDGDTWRLVVPGAADRLD